MKIPTIQIYSNINVTESSFVIILFKKVEQSEGRVNISRRFCKIVRA